MIQCKLKINNEWIAFNEEDHIYKNIIDGVFLTGVTSILGARGGKDYLKFWTVKEMYNFLIDNWDIKKEYTKKEKEELLLAGKRHWQTKSKSAMDYGSQAHGIIESIILSRMNNTPIVKHLDVPQEVKNAVNEFLKWEKKHKVEWLATELIVGSQKHSFAGTIDFIAIVDGISTLGDFKTSSHISEDAFLQTAGYHIALEECLEEKEKMPKQRLIIRIPKDGTEFEALIVKTDLEFDKEIFLHLKDVHHWGNYINKFKNMEGKFI